MILSVSNNIRITDSTDKIREYAKKELVVANPEYFKAEQLGHWTGNMEKELYLYSIDAGEYIFPFGTLADIFELEKGNIQYTLDFAPKQESHLEGNINLYPYQERALQALIRGKNGILEGCCGCGKTQIGLALIKALGLKALWLTHTQKLLQQSKERCERYFKGDFGTITEGKCEIGKDITFATVQTLSKLDRSIYENAFNVIIVDECHHASGTPTQVHQFYKVLSSIKARYKYGMSATLTRSDGLIQCVYAILGRKLHTITREEIGEKIIRAYHEEFPITWKYAPDEYAGTDGMIDYNKMISSICANRARNMQIATNVIKRRMEGRKQLILTARVSHAYELQKLIPNSSVVVGSIPEKKRDYSNTVLIATYALAKEGLDIPELDTLHLATPSKDKITVIQSVGRIERATKDKKEPIVYDYVDENIGYCKMAYTKRKNFLKKR